MEWKVRGLQTRESSRDEIEIRTRVLQAVIADISPQWREEKAGFKGFWIIRLGSIFGRCNCCLPLVLLLVFCIKKIMFYFLFKQKIISYIQKYYFMFNKISQ